MSPAACRSGSYRANRGAIRSTTSPNAALHRSGSTLCAAATAAASVFHTSSECLPGGRPSRLRHAPTVSHQHQRSRSTAVVLGVDEHVWRPGRYGAGRDVTVMVDLTRASDGRLRAWLLDVVLGRSGTAYKNWLD